MQGRSNVTCELAFARSPVGALAAEERRREIVGQLGAGPELLLNVFLEPAVGQQPGDLIFILICEEPRIASRSRHRERCRARRDPLFGCLDLVNQMLEARCRSEEHTSELQSLMRISYAVFCLKK